VIAELIEQILDAGEAVRFVVNGDSMYPAVRDGDAVVIERAADVRRGDIVLARLSRGLTVHRLVRIRDGMYIMRGDNLDADDEPISTLMGRVKTIERNGVIWSAAAMPPLFARMIRVLRVLRARASSRA
jgi:phage repressor protein C with HTH and peptisase S24 domain